MQGVIKVLKTVKWFMKIKTSIEIHNDVPQSNAVMLTMVQDGVACDSYYVPSFKD